MRPLCTPAICALSEVARPQSRGDARPLELTARESTSQYRRPPLLADATCGPGLRPARSGVLRSYLRPPRSCVTCQCIEQSVVFGGRADGDAQAIGQQWMPTVDILYQNTS